MTLAQTCAVLAVIAFVVLAVFQAGLALGLPWGRAAWGGRNAGVLPRNLRLASGVSMIVWLVAALIVLDRAGLPVIALPQVVSFWGTWLLAGLLALGALMNVASSSPYERFGWGPLAAATCALVIVVALS